ncbi:MAG: 5-formyltetrahydrofolate cyclo-ligase [Nitrospiraceae bacterium]|nr:5-formyltetrahydrofolate cyclo-ligase [Nitrospiraceae bacterium]
MQPPDKSSIRADALKKRNAIPEAQRLAKSGEIAARLAAMRQFGAARTVLLYASFKSEVDTSGLIRESLEAGRKVLLPRVAKDGLEVFEIKGPEDMEKGVWGIPEPKRSSRAAGVNEADVIIVPGVAFDSAGARVGYGKGYYDRLLANLEHPVPLIALSFEAQMYNNKLPVSGHDILMDFIITELRTIEARKHGR